MTPPRKLSPNGDAVPVALALLQQATERNREDINNLGRKFDDHAIGTEKRLDSLEQSRAEGKGRAAVIAILVSLLMNVVGALIIFTLTSDRTQGMPEPSPTVTVTLPASIVEVPQPAQTRFISFHAPASPTPTESSSPSPSPSPPTPTPTPPNVVPPPARPIVAALIDTACAPVRFLWWLLYFCP